MMLMRSFPKTCDHSKFGENDRISICEECLIIIKKLPDSLQVPPSLEASCKQ